MCSDGETGDPAEGASVGSGKMLQPQGQTGYSGDSGEEGACQREPGLATCYSRSMCASMIVKQALN